MDLDQAEGIAYVSQVNEQHVWWSQKCYVVDWRKQVSDSPRGRLEKQASQVVLFS